MPIARAANRDALHVKEPRPPQVSASLAAFSGPLTPSLSLEQMQVNGGAFAKARVESVRFDGVHVVSTTFEESKLVDLGWLDVSCEKSALGMIDWRGASLTRVEVRGCRLTGGKLAEARLQDVRFVDCQLDYFSFCDSRFTRVAFESCQLREADFHGADVSGTAFVDCDLQRADFTKAKLRGTDVSRSNATGITVGTTEIRGLVVSREQASALAALFGLVTRE